MTGRSLGRFAPTTDSAMSFPFSPVPRQGSAHRTAQRPQDRRLAGRRSGRTDGSVRLKSRNPVCVDLIGLSTVPDHQLPIRRGGDKPTNQLFVVMRILTSGRDGLTRMPEMGLQ